MREILFRGKEVGTGLWVEGALVPEDSETCSILTFDHHEDDMYRWTKVVSETVGQFTGLLDKNGKKVFEGDIVTTPSASSKGVKLLQRKVTYCPVKLKWSISMFVSAYTEVVGNVWDNAEMVKQS